MSKATAPDGSPVILYRRLPATDDLEVVRDGLPLGATVLDLGCGAGRLANPLAAMGCAVTAVDESAEMLAHVRGCETVQARIEGLDLGRPFDRVVLAGNLINTMDADQRRAFLATCERHLAADAALYIQRVDPEWAATAQPFTSEHDGIHYTFTDVEADGIVLTGNVRYRGWDLDVTHRFRLRVLEDADLEASLREAGLSTLHRPNTSWVIAGRPAATVKDPRANPPTRSQQR